MQDVAPRCLRSFSLCGETIGELVMLSRCDAVERATDGHGRRKGLPGSPFERLTIR